MAAMITGRRPMWSDKEPTSSGWSLAGGGGAFPDEGESDRPAWRCVFFRQRQLIAVQGGLADLNGVEPTREQRVEPRHLVPFTLQWNPDRAQTTAVARFVHTALTADPPPGWLTQPGHLRHQATAVGKP